MVKTSKKDTSKEEKKESLKLTKKISESILDLMTVDAKVVVIPDEEGSITVDINTSEAGLVIGNRGRTLDAIQTLIAMMVRQKLGEWKRIVVNTSDWREKEKERLEQLALRTAERVKETGRQESLYNLSSSQRRIVHLTLAGQSEVKTESIGEGKDRYLVIKPQ
ncbi:hypothetical protein A2892_03320 [Candidatus Woesebacteria bacterium RIFCSPLOWO2_01_FULL_39_10b]|uniref:R3H domain-containing protein n=1 Tax=Candidatus Woesebacteria bacterium RIFCSPLOWO2_01_FULL_39_10b TaxID=1802517 RepID=A0A1F8B8H3_9BACT|nr:MAG: hypothetical protein A2892_03320 [Candidatus Woesebacteria bacterium RIFCSPLOWO2_01_FULL_39_10b]